MITASVMKGLTLLSQCYIVSAKQKLFYSNIKFQIGFRVMNDGARDYTFSKDPYNH